MPQTIVAACGGIPGAADRHHESTRLPEREAQGVKCYLCDNKLRSRKRAHCQECIRAMQQIHDSHANECKEKHPRLDERIERYQGLAEQKRPLFV